jgi:tetratricopeptide (TPR) repeat protein
MIPGAGNIAFGAHLAGYAFGFAGAAGMLAIHALPRDQFDIVALWRRWFQRQTMKAAMSTPEAQARAQYGRVARPVSLDEVKTATGTAPQPDPITELRLEIAEALSHNDRDTAAQLYEKILELDPRQVLSRQHQLDVANQLCTLHRLPQAGAAYEKYLSTYASAPEAVHVRLMLGIIYARDLQQYEVAEGHLTLSLGQLTDDKRRQQCQHWLNIVAQALGKPGPEPST